MSKLKFVDLFAGIGGFHRALSELGHECVFASELDENLRSHYIENFPIVRGGRLSSEAIRELTRTSREIAGLLPIVEKWERPKPFKGVVVGAVQSGKTQSMMGVAAIALDNGFRIVVVLAGLKDDLRTQTARRFNGDLLLQSDAVVGVPGATTLGRPVGSCGAVRGYAPPYHVDCHDYAPLAPRMMAALGAGQPCVVVIKKHPASLSDLSMVLSDIYTRFGADSMPTLVLDDECDEASVPQGASDKAIPDAIYSLWSGVEPVPPVAYVGYTATAAANLLQHQDWPLYPHWTYLLRYPGGREDAIQYRELAGDNWYSGSDCYYSDFGEVPGEADNFLLETPITDEHLNGPVASNLSLRQAFYAYFVAGAFRLALSPKRSFEDLECLPEPHSMMIHTSSAQEDHNRWAIGIRQMFDGSSDKDSIKFSAIKLNSILAEEEDVWRSWYFRFVDSRERIYESRPHADTHAHPTWEQIKSRLPEVFENVRLKVVNSDVDGGTLEFKPPLNAKGVPIRKPDIYVIAVGGSRLSRGITVEGLCISYFARWANTRHDDAVLQMGRWFGYRGRYLEFCRLFTTPAAYLGLREVAENDLQLRAQLSQLMQERKAPVDATLVFNASPYSLPTAKMGVGLTVDLSFSPFSRVLPRLEITSLAPANEMMAQDLVAAVKKRNFAVVHRNGGQQRGYLSTNWDALEIADILDGWLFEQHNPNSGHSLLDGRYRKTDPLRKIGVLFEPDRDPYHIAAYLRHWSGLEWTGPSVPRFNVGVAFGELKDETGKFDFPLLNREVTVDSQVVGGWTGSSSNWRGDKLFDNPDPALIDERGNRMSGSPGLLLLYVVHRDATGKAGRGTPRQFHAPFIGISVPGGGPDFIRITTATGAPRVKH